jgi:hypothetical protein
MRRVNLYPSLRSKFTVRLSDAAATNMTAPPDPRCGANSAVESDPPTLLGFPVVANVQKRISPDGKTATIQTWSSPALDCLVMRKEVVVRDSQDQMVTKELTEVTRVAVEDPDEQLFGIPENYTERLPSEVYAAETARLGDPACSRCPKKHLQEVDDRYNRSRP